MRYRISHTWKKDVLKIDTTTITKKIASIAFIDDMTWMALNQENLEKILSIADEFYRITNTAINKEKSELIVHRKIIPKSIDLKFENENITILSIIKPIRFLGV